MLEDELEKIKEFKECQGVIDLQYMGVNNWTIKALSTLGCNTLIHLNFSRNEVTNETLSFLTKIPLPSLFALDIHWNRYNGNGIKNLVKGHFPALQYLYLSGNELGLEGVTFLMLAPWNLKELGLTYTLSLTNQPLRISLQAKIEPLIRVKFPRLGPFIF